MQQRIHWINWRRHKETNNWAQKCSTKMGYPPSNLPTHPNNESQYWLGWVNSLRATHQQSTRIDIRTIRHSQQWQRHEQSSDCSHCIIPLINNRHDKWISYKSWNFTTCIDNKDLLILLDIFYFIRRNV